MIRIIDERENYMLVSDGARFTVVERRAGRFYSLRSGPRHGVALDNAGVAAIIRESGWYTEITARQLLDEIVTRRQDLAEHLW
jgi:hypothetical protein